MMDLHLTFLSVNRAEQREVDGGGPGADQGLGSKGNVVRRQHTVCTIKEIFIGPLA